MNFLSVNDASVDELIALAQHYKAHPLTDKQLGENKTLGMLFLNPSMRTRLSTQIAARNLGMEVIVFNVGAEGWALEFDDVAMNGNRSEHIKDAAPVLGRYFDILAIRTFPSLQNREEDYSEQYINQFVKYGNIPVVSLESGTLHPLQSAADVMTIAETFKEKRKPKIALTWAPHVKPLPHCVSNSFAQWINRWGKADFVIANPEGYDLKEEFTQGASVLHSQDEALKNADYVYVKNWCSYETYGAMPEVKSDWLLTLEKLKLTNNGKVMHCLPVRRDVELSAEVLDSASSIVASEAGNRVWATQAVLSQLLRSIKK